MLFILVVLRWSRLPVTRASFGRVSVVFLLCRWSCSAVAHPVDVRAGPVSAGCCARDSASHRWAPFSRRSPPRLLLPRIGERHVVRRFENRDGSRAGSGSGCYPETQGPRRRFLDLGSRCGPRVCSAPGGVCCEQLGLAAARRRWLCLLVFVGVLIICLLVSPCELAELEKGLSGACG